MCAVIVAFNHASEQVHTLFQTAHIDTWSESGQRVVRSKRIRRVVLGCAFCVLGKCHPQYTLKCPETVYLDIIQYAQDYHLCVV